MQGRFDRQLKAMMEQEASSRLAPSCLWPVLLAVSGGVDSMTMADLFLHSSLKPSFALAHCNFSLRGAESDGDEALVTSWAEEHDVRLFKIRFDTVAYAREHSLSIEMAARELRYNWFSELCQVNGFVAVAVAHNANDDVETLFLNLLRGTGVRGLSGMEPVGRLPVPAQEGQGRPLLLRPLLDFTRKQIEGYAFARGLCWREDHTNAEDSYKRNRLRNQVFPLFEKINPSYLKTLRQEMQRFGDAEEILSDWYHCHKEVFLLPAKGEEELVVISVRELLSQAHWPYLLFRTLESYGFRTSALDGIESLLRSGKTLSGKVFRGDGYELVTTTDRLIVRACPATEEDSSLEISGPGCYAFRGHHYEIRVLERKPDFCLKQPAGRLVLDAETLPFPFYFRSWRVGDWFVPFGMKGRKKVSDFFADHKFSKLDKEKAALLVRDLDKAASRISAVSAYRSDDLHKVHSGTGKLLLISQLD